MSDLSRTPPKNRPRSLRRPLLWVLVLVVTPIAILSTTLIDAYSAINTEIGGKRVYLRRMRRRSVTPPVVRSFTLPWGQAWTFSAGRPVEYLVFVGEGAVESYGDDMVILVAPDSLTKIPSTAFPPPP